MSARLQTRYTLIILTLVVSLGVALSVLLYVEFKTSSERLNHSANQLMQHTLRAQLHKQAAAMARTLASNLAEPLYRYDLDTIYHLTRGLTQAPDVQGVYVYDLEGKIIHDGHWLIPQFQQSIVPLLPSGAPLANEPHVWFAAQRLYLNEPIYSGATRLGGVLLIYTLDSAQQAADALSADLTQQLEHDFARNLSFLLLTLALFCLLALVLSWRLARGLTAPIQQLIRHTRALGNGQLAQNLRLERQDELGELTAALNEMGHRLQRSMAHIEHLAYHDELTGLYNRTYFQQTLSEAIHADPHAPFALLYLDLDNFKTLNDTQGHDKGDLLLQQIAKDLQRALTPTATGPAQQRPPLIARFGGDEFVLALFDLPATEHAERMAERILHTLREGQASELRQIHAVRASIGIALYPQDGRTLSALLKNADIALAEAKRDGKDGYKRITPELQRRLTRAYQLEQALPRALAQNRLTMHYQPQVDLRSGRLCGCEALIRWHHETLGWISPTEFLPLAEASPLIARLGNWVIDRVCRDARQLQPYLPDSFRVSLNLSGAQFALQDVQREIERALRRYELPPQRLAVELTETALLRNPEQVCQQLQLLQAQGIAVWLDDFGTGYSSLSYLHRLPIQGIKIDKSFISGLSETQQGDAQLNWTIVTLADTLELDITAEGVETPFQHQLMRELGVHKGQGYLYGKAMPLDALRQLLRDDPRFPFQPQPAAQAPWLD